MHKEERMKITAGLGCADDYPDYVRAGADEMFCGYIPHSWSEKYGTRSSLNRREVRFCNVQIGAFHELKILRKMQDYYGVPVTLAFNSLLYTPEQYPEVAGEILRCMEIGYDTYIIADPALIVYLRSRSIPCRIHLSGETGEINGKMIQYFERLQTERIIFHRKISPEYMKACIGHIKKKSKGERGGTMEYEAFLLNEMCHFNGAWCQSLHCDELGHLCRVPYRLHRRMLPEVPENREVLSQIEAGEKADPDWESAEAHEAYLTGSSGCGLCALHALREAGIDYLKIVGRGNYPDYMIRDIRAARKALHILEYTGTEMEFRREMKRQIFPEGCSTHCYYR